MIRIDSSWGRSFAWWRRLRLALRVLRLNRKLRAWGLPLPTTWRLLRTMLTLRRRVNRVRRTGRRLRKKWLALSAPKPRLLSARSKA